MFETSSDNSLIFLSLANMIRTFTSTRVEVLELTGEEAELLKGYHVAGTSRDEVVFSSLFRNKLGVTCKYRPPDGRRRKKNKFDIFYTDQRADINSSVLKPLCDSEISEKSKHITLDEEDFHYHLSLILRYPNLGGVGETTRNPFNIDKMTPAVHLFLRLEYLVQSGQKYKWTDKAAEVMQMSYNWDEKKRCIEELSQMRLEKEIKSRLKRYLL